MPYSVEIKTCIVLIRPMTVHIRTLFLLYVYVNIYQSVTYERGMEFNKIKLTINLAL